MICDCNSKMAPRLLSAFLLFSIVVLFLSLYTLTSSNFNKLGKFVRTWETQPPISARLYKLERNKTYVKDLCDGSDADLTLPGRRVLAYTMFGSNALKRYGQYVKDVATESARSKFYADWNVWVYHEGDMTEEFIAEIKRINPLARVCDVRQVDKVLNTDLKNKNGMAWRFLPVGDRSVDIACPRDLDSPLYVREEVAVDEWLKSGTILHVMRDSIYHTSEVMGGLWCFRNMKDWAKARHVLDLVLGKAQGRNSAKKSESSKGDDQNVLNRHVWPLVAGDRMHHDAYLCARYKGSIPYSTKRNTTFNFIGCRRPCYGAMEDKPIKCPEQCRPVAHKDWEYC